MVKKTTDYNIMYADFETTSQKDFDVEGKVRVYLWCLMDEFGNEKHGSTIDEFLEETVGSLNGDNIIYFHNLKFDSSFIMSALLELGYATDVNPKNNSPYTINYLGDSQVVYSVNVITPRGNCIEFRDSLKLFPGMSIATLGVNVGFDKLSELITYDRRHPEGESIDQEELQYMIRDVEILRQTMLKHFEETDGNIYLTRAGYAEKMLKESVGSKKWKKWFSRFDLFDASEMRSAYFGGYVYVNPKYQGKVVGEGIALDNNSMFPGAMATKKLPVGKPEHFEGSYEDNKFYLEPKGYDLYVVKLTNLKFSLKEGHIASLPKQLGRTTLVTCEKDLNLRNMNGFMLSNLDLKHFINNYNIESITYDGGFAFKSKEAIFKDFVDYYGEQKKLSKYGPFKSDTEREQWKEETGKQVYDPMGYLSAKLLMNSSYGKFGQNPFQDSVNVTLREDGKLDFEIADVPDDKTLEDGSWHYLPAAIFITAWGRDILLNMAERFADRVLYCDTDSIHMLGKNVPKEMEELIDDTKLTYWKVEEDFEAGKYLRDKTYAELLVVSDTYQGDDVVTYKGKKGVYDIKAAGLTPESKATIESFDDFTLEREYPLNRTARRVKGGTLIVNVSKKIRNTLII